ncbi:glutamyl-tRNA amidotransferase subunit A [Tothia fuscella]|uniref:Glutamyl-tRNA amidotransferase subunit A n=1 Tax=Tothia fuscella TaxID=1048955 RepID=A0A9P4NYW1_9PEZI|nr:glutamyl-tRNA amidotransferase subunit A [Tothia fuscella]
MAAKLSFSLMLSALSFPICATIPPLAEILSFPSVSANISQILDDPFPYYFPAEASAGTPKLFAMPKCHGVTLQEATIDQLQDYMNQEGLADYGYINSVLEISPDFLASLDAERAAGTIRGPLHGIPYMVKDNIATKDKMETTAGSYALLGSVVPRDAFVVSKLRSAGALFFGKATLSEWADMRSNNYSEGYSARGGQARSPYNLTVNPGGSSSGGATGVAANVFTFALGTETDGSVINPAERNAIVGFKPTVGLTSRAGVIPESNHQDTVGTFGKTVKDAVYAIDAIYGPDPLDNYTSAQIGKTPLGGYTQFLTTKSSLANATFGIPGKSFWVHADEEQLAILTSLLTLIEAAGATIVNNTELPLYETIVSPDGWSWDYGTTRGYPNESEYTVIKVDFYNNIQTYLSELTNTQIRTLEDIISYNEANDGTEGGFAYPLGNPAFYSGQDGFHASAATKGVMDETYYQALSFIQSSTRENGIDAALSLSPDGSGIKLNALLVPSDVGQSYQIAAQAGYPMLTIPVGVHEVTGMGFGLGFMQTAWGEEELVRWGSAVEDLIVTEGRRKFGRTSPKWYGYLERNLPVRNL